LRSYITNKSSRVNSVKGDENENDSDPPEPEEQRTIQSPRPKIMKNIQFKEGLPRFKRAQ